MLSTHPDAPPRAVLFDLDGTLVDSAPDLGAAANRMRARRGRDALPLQDYRPHCGSGARGMLAVAFEIGPAHPHFNDLRDEFLAEYECVIAAQSTLFAGVPQVLQALNRSSVPWGVVTNKAERLAHLLCLQMGLEPPVLVGGDTTAFRKPSPVPVLEASRRLNVASADCIYVGDDPRDVEAGRAAGMRTAAATWGYLGVDLAPAHWQATHELSDIAELLQLLRLP